jgi:nucleoside-diphosphate-sugar epimerase
MGSWVTPRLVETGHSVICVSRSQRQPYCPHEAWRAVERVVLDRGTAEAEGTFGTSALALRPEVVIDLTCYTLESARHLAESLRGRVQQFLHRHVGRSVTMDAAKRPSKNTYWNKPQRTVSPPQSCIRGIWWDPDGFR